MSFQITEIIEAKADGLVVKVLHQDHQVHAVLPDKRRDDITLGVSFQAGIGFDRILEWKIIDDFDDIQSGIWQAGDSIHLLGRVHSVVDFGDGRTMVDVYIRNGSEFFKLDLETIGIETFASDSGLEVTVGSLYIYPADR